MTTIVLKVIVVLVGLALSVFLFRKAAGTIDIGKINIVSYIMYLFILMTYIGASLVYLGDRNHYTMKVIMHPVSYDIMYYCVLATAILLPLTMIAVFKLLRVNAKEAYSDYLKKEISIPYEKQMFWFIAIFGAICCLLLLFYIKKIGYFPLLSSKSALEVGTERQRISKIVVVNEYVKNILIGTMIPLLSYVAFAYTLKIKKPLWIALTAILVGSSIVTVTIDFEKSPIIFYLFVLLLIVIYSMGGIPKKIIVLFVVCMAGVMALIYLRNDYDFTSSNNFYNGPIGRTIFTQVGTLTMHFDLFPAVFPFLAGRSLSPTALSLLHIHGSSARSGKVVMDFYGSDKVYQGSGGVMNAFFVGESYANFGFVGMVLSIIYMGLFIALCFYVFMKMKKTPFNIAMVAFLTSRFAQATQSGFTDFIYNIQTIMIFALILVVDFAPKIYQFLLLFKRKLLQS